jgi:RNA polymerase sigma-70 factor (ECF subfamily)
MTATIQQIWETFRSRLYAYVRARSRSADDAEDILQEVFVKIHQRIETLNDDARLTSWLYRVTHNTIVDYYRKRRATPVPNPPERPACYDDEGPTPEQTLAPFLRELLDGLPKPYREALQLTEVEGLTQQEMGCRLGLSTSGAKSRVQRGRAMLREKLIDCCDIELDARGYVVEFSSHGSDPWPEHCQCDPSDG